MSILLLVAQNPWIIAFGSLIPRLSHARTKSDEKLGDGLGTRPKPLADCDF